MERMIIIGVIFIISVVFNFLVNASDFTTASFATISPFFGSMVLGYVVSMFVAKYKVNDWRMYWSVFYGFMVGISILSYVLNLVPPGAKY